MSKNLIAMATKMAAVATLEMNADRMQIVIMKARSICLMFFPKSFIMLNRSRLPSGTLVMAMESANDTMTKKDVVFVNPARVAAKLSTAPNRYIKEMQMKQVMGVANVSVSKSASVMASTPTVCRATSEGRPNAS